MPLDPRLWTALEQHGVSNAHLQALLKFLQCQADGSFTWHGRQGKLEQCELKVNFSCRGHTMQRITDIVLESDRTLQQERVGTNSS